MYKENDLVRVVNGSGVGDVFVIGDTPKSGLGFDIEPVTHLTTNEFIKLVEDMGYEVYLCNGAYHVNDKSSGYKSYAFVYTEQERRMETYNINELLFKVCFLYANTPLELREEKEKLYTLELPNNNKKHKYYQHMYEDNKHYTFGKLRKGDTWKCYFTQKEIDELPNQELIKALKQEPVK